MASSVFFVQHCPACGRSLQVRVDYLGKAIGCQHCQANFVAQQEESHAPSESGLGLLDRADELLRAAEEYRAKREHRAKQATADQAAVVPSE